MMLFSLARINVFSTVSASTQSTTKKPNSPHVNGTRAGTAIGLLSWSAGTHPQTRALTNAPIDTNCDTSYW
jgi:hypothetical protein